jgi:hypothetical protein
LKSPIDCGCGAEATAGPNNVAGIDRYFDTAKFANTYASPRAGRLCSTAPSMPRRT